MTHAQYWTVACAIIVALGPLVGVISSAGTGVPKKQGVTIAVVLSVIAAALLYAYIQAAYPMSGINLNAPSAP